MRACVLASRARAHLRNDERMLMLAEEKFARDLFARAAREVGGIFDSAQLWDAWYAFEEARSKDVVIDGARFALSARLAAVAFRAAAAPINPTASAKYFEKFSQHLGEGVGEQIAASIAEILDPVDLQRAQQASGGTVAAVWREIAQRRHDAAQAEAEAISEYEATISKTFFHVKPLTQEQKRGWHEYIRWASLSSGSRTRTHERERRAPTHTASISPEDLQIYVMMQRRRRRHTKTGCSRRMHSLPILFLA